MAFRITILNFRKFYLNIHFMISKIFIKDRTYRFLFFGFINVVLSNLILQVLLLFISPFKATFLSQTVNFLLGYYLYSRKVFKIKKLMIKFLFKYFILVILLWNINWILIEYFYSLGISKNFFALVLVPFLALISYISQKYVVFKY